jgi:serine/threonine protein kinase
MLFTNDSMLLSQEMSATSQLVLQQNPRLSNNSTVEEGGQSGGGEEARDHFATDGLATLSDWEIRPEEIEYMKRPDGSDWELGTGGFGKVYKALRNGAQPVAVKVLMSGPETRYMALNEFRREVAILKACRDPNIVAFLGACMHDDCAMLVTEYCEGGNLARNIVASKVTWYRRGRRIALDIAKGLVFLHSRRIVHLDLKSPNILLSRDGTAKIADVGLAKIIAQEYSAVTGAVGTLAWSSPEMLLGARCTERSDIYSYGVVLWEIATGQTPIRGQLRDVKVPEECPDELRKLMLDCLEQNPRRRPTAVQIIERLRKIPVSPREHAPALPQGSTPTRGMMVPRAVTGAAKPRVPLGAGAAAAKTAPARAPPGVPPVVAEGEGISPFAMAAAGAEAAAADMSRLASNAGDSIAGKPSGTVLGSQEDSSLALAPSSAMLAPAGSLPTPFKVVQQQQQQQQQERQAQSELGTQLPSSEGSSDLVSSSRDPGSTAMSRAGSGAVLSPSRKGSLPVRPASRQPSLPGGGLPPGMPRPPPSPFAAAGGSSLSPGQQPSSPQNGNRETPR